MKQTARYIPIEQVVQFYISEANLTDAHFLRLWQIAVRGLEMMGWSFAQEPVTRKLSVLPNLIVELPGDYIEWCKVGVLNDRGEVATLKYNDNLTGYAATESDRTTQAVGQYSGLDTLSNFRNFYYNESYVNLLGLPYGTENLGEFKVLQDEGIVILNKDYQYDHIILEYLPSADYNTELLMPVMLREALISWIRWKEKQSMPSGRRVNNGTRQLDRKDYYTDLRNAKALLRKFRLTTANDVIRINNRLAVKA